MIDNPPKMKTLYLNGVVVGEVKMTGDIEKDMEIARSYLAAKRLYKEKSLVSAMLTQAVSFGKTARNIYDSSLANIPHDQYGVAPFSVNSTFSIEIYLKTLSSIFSKPQRGHELLSLYDNLPSEALKALKENSESYKNGKNLTEIINIREILSVLNNAFVEWRYCFELERTSLVTPRDVFFVLDILHTTCVSSQANISTQSR